MNEGRYPVIFRQGMQRKIDRAEKMKGDLREDSCCGQDSDLFFDN